MSETHDASNLDKNLKTGLILNSGFTIFEFIVGTLSGSLALISDAGHNLTDSLSILISIFGNRIAQRKANPEHSYGYGRASILTAFVNAFILITLALYIFYEAAHRIYSHPREVQGTTIMIVAAVGIVVNGTIAYILSKNKKDLNVRSTFVNMAMDVVALVGTLIAGFLIVITKQSIIDPIISIFIGIMLIYGAWGVARDAIHIMLEGVPIGIDVKKVKEAIMKTAKVKNVDDMHIWAISSQYAALSCHIVIEDCDLEKSTQLVKQLKTELRERFNIEHATIETELVECPPNTT